MAQSLSKLIVHIVFGTKNRVSCLNHDICRELYPYISTVLKNLECPAIQIGGVDDHVHLLCCLSKNLSLAKLVEGIKKPTSKLLKSKGPAYEKFYWQNGYGGFSVSQSDVKRVRDYILNQETHHRRLTFQEEYRRFLDKYQVPYDERYVWD